MAENVKTNKEFSEAPPRVSETRRFFRIFLSRPVVIIGAVIMIVFLLMAFFPQIFTSIDPYKHNLKAVLVKPGIDGDHQVDGSGGHRRRGLVRLSLLLPWL